MENFREVAEELRQTLVELKARGNYYDAGLLQKARTLHARLAPVYERLGFGTGPIQVSGVPPRLWWSPWYEQVVNAIAAIDGGHPQLRQPEGDVSDDGYDVAQICMNGHAANPSSTRLPQYNTQFCQHCGVKTITSCPNCGEGIRGRYWGSGVLIEEYEPPRFCHNCGSAYPWTDKALDAVRDLARQAENLTDAERQALADSLDDLVRDTPGTPAAGQRVKLLLSKTAKGTGQAIRDVLVGVVTEAAKKSIGLS